MYVTFAGITVSFEASQYSIVEGEPVPVCAEIISGNSLIRFTLGLSVTTDAEGSGHIVIILSLYYKTNIPS